MKPLAILFFFLLLSVLSFSQNDISATRDSIERDGRRMYRSEMASWYGTDILLDKFKDRRQDIGGYFSYAYSDSTRCVFFDKGTEPLVLASISFDSSYKPENAVIEGLPRKFTSYEKDIYVVRKAALDQINADTIFKVYKNTSLNLVPLIEGNEKKVYVLTGPKNDGVIIFGNDYLLTFDNDNNLASKRRLHKNIVSMEYSAGVDTTQTGITMHTHLPETGDLITATDICTLMLYEKFAKWKQHYVISKNYISIWDCDKNMLVTLTMEAWNKISKDQAKRHGKN